MAPDAGEQREGHAEKGKVRVRDSLRTFRALAPLSFVVMLVTRISLKPPRARHQGAASCAARALCLVHTIDLRCERERSI